MSVFSKYFSAAPGIRLILLCLLAAGASNALLAETPRAVAGVMDLSEFDLNTDNFKLEGEWEFYWEELRGPEDFAATSKPSITAEASATSSESRPAAFAVLPAPWNRIERDGVALGSEGFATYRLRVILPKESGPVALKIADQGTAFRLFVNGRPIAANGRVGTDRASSRPGSLPMVVFLEATGPRIEFILQISNYDHRFGGPRYPIQLGSHANIHEARSRALLVDWFLAGCLLFMGVYHLGLFLDRRQYLPPLYFALFCLLIVLRTLITDERYLFHVFPGMDWEWGQRLEFFSFYAAVPAYGMFLHSTFREEFDARALRIIKIVSGFSILATLLTPTRLFSWTAPLMQVLTLFVLLYSILVLVRAARGGRTGARSFLFGILVGLGAFVNDVLFSVGAINTQFVMPLGVVVFMFSQALLLSRRFTGAFRTAEELSTHLETRVAERTEELQRAMELSEASSRAKTEFLANMSHEIRTPMNAILGYTDLALEEQLPAAVREYMSIVQLRGQDLKVLINDILDVSRIEAGRLELDPVPVDTRRLIEEVATTFELAAREKEIELRHFVQADVPIMIRADSVRLRQVLINLVSNAIKFTDSGEVEVSLELIDRRDNRLRFTVRDSGIGIPPQKQDLIFDLFTQADGSTNRKYGGTGLGLYICRQLLRLMGGTIQLTSEVGRGSSFYFELNAELALDEQSASQTTPDGTNDGGAGERILVTDDDALNRLLIQRILEKAGYTVHLAPSGQDTLDFLAKEAVDLILMDGQMPDMDGFETTRNIRLREEANRTKRVTIIALTGLSMDGDRERCLAAGMDDYVSKPIEKKELLATIRQKLDGA